MAKKKRVTKTSTRPTAADLLVEIGTEELPPKALRQLSESFARELYDALRGLDLIEAQAPAPEPFATPRRLAVIIPGVRLQQPTRQIERRGPALTAAFDAEGRPTSATQGFARSCGTTADKLARLETDKGAWLVFRKQERGQSAAKLIPAAIDQALKKLPIPKRMRWSDLDAEFIRPVHWVCVLHGTRVVPCTILSQRAGAVTRGHRFLHPAPIRLKSPADYARTLAKTGRVIPSFAQRRDAVARGVESLATKLGGKANTDDAALLDEVTALVEWPQALAGEFDRSFLDVPSEVLVSAMRDHQRYFHVTARNGKLLPHFITVTNTDAKGGAQIRAGNERVLRARLADARFFWDSDRKVRLDARIGDLKDVMFHKKLGSVYDKSRRVAQLATHVAERIGVDAAHAQRAAQLAKADLLSGMVGEFPELQGAMGRYYARHDGEADDVAEAIEEQYRPRFAGDRIAMTGVGQALAIADKLDTLVGLFGAGEPPTGDRDPYGLRRAALGILHTLIEGGRDIDLPALIEQAIANFEGAFPPETARLVYDFMLERLRHHYLQEEGRDQRFAPDEVDAVIALKPASPYDIDRRLHALRGFRRLREAESLAAANKRIRNILRQANGTAYRPVDEGLLREDAERELAAQVGRMSTQVAPLFATRDYAAALKQLAALRAPVDAFFDRVMVMTEDPNVRANRLALLNDLSELFLQVADLSRLQGGETT